MNRAVSCQDVKHWINESTKWSASCWIFEPFIHWIESLNHCITELNRYTAKLLYYTRLLGYCNSNSMQLPQLPVNSHHHHHHQFSKFQGSVVGLDWTVWGLEKITTFRSPALECFYVKVCLMLIFSFNRVAGRGGWVRMKEILCSCDMWHYDDMMIWCCCYVVDLIWSSTVVWWFWR